MQNSTGTHDVETSHLLPLAVPEELWHHHIQLSELVEGGDNVSVKVFVFLILVIENSFVLFPFFHTADLWIFSSREDFKQDWSQFVFSVSVLQSESLQNISFRYSYPYFHSHDVVSDDLYFGDVFRCSVQTDWILVALGFGNIWTHIIVIPRLIRFISERYTLCFLKG